MFENQIYIKKATLVILLAVIVVAVTLAVVFASFVKTETPANCQQLSQTFNLDDFDCDACIVSNCPFK